MPLDPVMDPLEFPDGFAEHVRPFAVTIEVDHGVIGELLDGASHGLEEGEQGFDFRGHGLLVMV